MTRCRPSFGDGGSGRRGCWFFRRGAVDAVTILIRAIALLIARAGIGRVGTVVTVVGWAEAVPIRVARGGILWVVMALVLWGEAVTCHQGEGDGPTASSLKEPPRERGAYAFRDSYVAMRARHRVCRSETFTSDATCEQTHEISQRASHADRRPREALSKAKV